MKLIRNSVARNDKQPNGETSILTSSLKRVKRPLVRETRKNKGNENLKHNTKKRRKKK